MARNEIYDGPISESIPSSVVSFSHRRNRKDSTTSFTYFQEDQEHLDWPNEDTIDAESDVGNLSDIETNESIRSSKQNLFKTPFYEGLYQLRRVIIAIGAIKGPDYESYDEDNDPTIYQLRYIDYRYHRLIYHPADDQFCLIGGWKDPSWTNAKGMRAGLDADDRDSREQVFGKNLIDIQQKSVFQLLMDELSWHLIIVRALDLITIVVPPALPATLSIGTNFALSRLKAHKIYCISPQRFENTPSPKGDYVKLFNRVNVGGKLDVICFDKTGTLTEDGLDVLGVRIVDHNRRFSDLLPKLCLASPTSYTNSVQDMSRYNNTLYTMATCHSLRVVDGELLGDPLDVKMFQFTGWSFEEGGSHAEEADSEAILPSIARPPAPLELGILRAFEFVSHLRRASVIVRQYGDTGASTFVKGAPESVKAICLPSSLPHDFDELLSNYTHKGYRVIACAAKYEPKLSWMRVQKMTRADAECDLEFLGFIIFENKLKPNTAETIAELNKAGIRNIMCTGDNILTAVSVARECGLISGDEQCFVPRFVQGNACSLNHYTLAISGEMFRWIVDFGSELLIKRVLVRGKVFARMSPDEKHELVEKLQSLDYCCGFCGDGANDCGALKAADVGVSLSDAEASVAAPFTSRRFDISCVPTLIRYQTSELKYHTLHWTSNKETGKAEVPWSQAFAASST
ncbi:P-type ATPase [Aspergillus luchuensis]|uniref:P-type ATPase n=1 Tax=Aspergillus kawachii TaxID=1069201 RepID=A0A146FYD0_ASPKA|nr:P-type ATPase [Aspergillus luchuensis]